MIHKTFFFENVFFLSMTQFFPSKPIFYLFWIGCLNCGFLLLHISPLYLRLLVSMDALIPLFSILFFFLLFLPLIEVILMDKMKVDVFGI
ncbi:hypothetical protein AMTRI_Chr04g179640 [Amborella trichopoda]